MEEEERRISRDGRVGPGRRIAVFLGLALALGFILGIPPGRGLVGCKHESEEDRVRAVIRKAVAAGNDKKVGDVFEDAVETFRGPRGASLQECRRILLGYFMQQGWIRAFEQDQKIAFVDLEHAKVELELVLARGNEVKKIEDVVPTNASRFLFTIELEKIGGDWKLTSADYAQKRL